ncbi:glycine rich domain-containing protein [Cohnella cholangitidis]|uniref:receptor protein-tyrosine kinase n=1 Tax=Cohnella cholangitidis TaxID=2598458 RepID=A0A7G5BU64_9BACL|nr:glycine rich domain-containing protein [Cohnella cholangitidis]QMV40498.1 hypothetical protein FPL14_04220 [Cohnella cholangitidis]
MKKTLTILMLLAMLMSSFLSLVPPYEVEAATVVGTSKIISPGGSTGRGGGVCLQAPRFVGYRVSVISETFAAANQFDAQTDTSDLKIVNKVKAQFSNHFPKLESSIIFIPSSCWTTDSAYSWWNASSGDLVTIERGENNKVDFDKKVRKIVEFDGPLPNLYYEGLRNRVSIVAATGGIDLKKLKNNGWKNVFNSIGASGAPKVWNYILKDETQIEKRIEEYTCKTCLLTGNALKDLEGDLKYVDLLMTLYALSPDDQRGEYAEAINRFLDGVGLSEKPILIAVDTVARFSAPAHFDSKMFIPSIEFVQWMHGGTPKTNLNSPDFPAGAAKSDTKMLIKKAADLAIREMPNRKRNTDLRGDDYRNNGFTWGYSGVTGDIFRTDSGVGVWSASSLKGIMQALEFDGPEYFGFIIAAGSHNIKRVECECSQSIRISNKAEIEGEVKEKIGKKSQLQISMKETVKKKLDNWTKLLSNTNESKLKMKVKLTRSGGTGSPIWSAEDSPEPSGSFVSVTKADLMNYLKGTPLTYYDDLTNYSVPKNSKVTFEYNVEIFIEGVRNDGSKYTYECSDGEPDSVTFFHKEDPPIPLIGEYFSAPVFWSEIKQGQPGAEQFEAMAGTPTTRNLFFASGGSEFIVDIEVEYVPDASTARNYTSFFTPVPCGWSMPPIPASYTQDVQPPMPTPRTATDDSGATFTETVTAVSRPYVKVPGTETTPPVMGTEYGWVQAGHVHTVGGYDDHWSHTMNYDYMKINRVHVWKLNKSRVDGMAELTDTEEFTASIVQGEPNVFANIASSNTSSAGRLRYSLETEQHDNVVWNEGPSDNTHANTDAGPVKEKEKFEERRNMTTDVTVVSDFLILQTSKGDQSVMYFEKTGPSKKTTEDIDVPKSSFEIMWTSNSLSAAKWSKKDTIAIGSYNGQFYNVNGKYSRVGGLGTVSTVFDSKPAGLNRPARPSAPLRLMNTNIDIPDTKRNGEYVTGESHVFYEYLSFPQKGSTFLYDTGYQGEYGAPGEEFRSAYSDSHSKVNNILVHNPVSVEDARVVSLAPGRDQRTADAKLLGGNLQQPTVEYEKRLKEGYVFTPSPPVYEEREIDNPNYLPPVTGEVKNYNYSGSVQEFVAPRSGLYHLEAWGAQGGIAVGSASANNRGGYAKGSVILSEGQKLLIYVGGQGESGTTNIDQCDCFKQPGYNGGGYGIGSAGAGGGGATDMRLGGSAIENRIIVAGGGGGDTTGSGASYGGNTSNLGSLFDGGDAESSRHVSSYPNDEGGGGGGYYGGLVNHGDDPKWSYGGSSYVSGSLAGAGVNAGNANMPAPGGGYQIGQPGNGYAKITVPDFPAQGTPTITTKVLVSPAITEPPEDAYEYVEVQYPPGSPVVTPDGTFQAGNFINLDYGFEIFFPNTGDFYGNGAQGLSYASEITGKGFVDNMDTTEWTQSKQVKFDFYVNYNGETYSPDEWIDLPVNCASFRCIYDFYVPLANSEAISALVQFRSFAINSDTPDYTAPKNKIRYENLAAKHSSIGSWNIDVVGRIGNLVIEDTGDFRFSNLFKEPKEPTDWIVKNLVKQVDLGKQKFIVGDTENILGEEAVSVYYLDNYGLLPYLRQKPLSLPLTPDHNNIPALRRQPVRLGYNVLADIQTLGNYSVNYVQIVPYYYHLNLTTGAVTPVDIYMKVNGSYKPINLFGAPAQPNWDAIKSNIYDYEYSLDWDAEFSRRNYADGEAANTMNVIHSFSYIDDGDNLHQFKKPLGSQHLFGNAQVMTLTERNRTFMGTSRTNGANNNPSSLIGEQSFGKQGQRWHFTYGLPSSAVAVKQGFSPIQANIEVLRNNTSVLLMAADIKAIGDTYALQYSLKGNNGVTKIAGKTFDFSALPYPVLTVFSGNQTSAGDLDVKGTH